MRARSSLGTTLILVFGTACATSHSPSTYSHRSHRSDHDAFASTFVSAKELSQTSGSLLEALQRVRPSMLASHGTAIFVSVDGSPPADVSLLLSIPASTVHDVRLVRATSGASRVAVTANGQVVAGDIIAVVTWAGVARIP